MIPETLDNLPNREEKNSEMVKELFQDALFQDAVSLKWLLIDPFL